MSGHLDAAPLPTHGRDFSSLSRTEMYDPVEKRVSEDQDCIQRAGTGTIRMHTT